MQGIESLIFLAFLIAIFYFMLIRPQKRRVQQHKQLVESTEVGDAVVTIGGMHGTVTAIGDDTVEIEVSPGTIVRFVRSAIARRVVDELEGAADEDIDDEDTPYGDTGAANDA